MTADHHSIQMYILKKIIRPNYNPFFSSLSTNFHEKNKKDDIILLEYMFIERATYTYTVKNSRLKSRLNLRLKKPKQYGKSVSSRLEQGYNLQIVYIWVFVGEFNIESMDFLRYLGVA